MSVNTYNRKESWPGYSPKVPNETFLNEAVDGDGTPVALTASVLDSILVAGNPAIEDLPILQPERNDEEVRQQGDGLGVGEVYDMGWTDGSASKMSKCVFGLHVKDTLGAITAAEITGNTKEVSTVACIASDGSNLNSKYFFFDGIDADGDNPVVKYYIWIDINNTGADPAIVGRTAVEVDIGAGVVTDTAVCAAIVAKIDALDDFGAAAGIGDNDHICTITNASNGAVDNVSDAGSTGFTFAVTTDGVTTKVITDSTTLSTPGFHNEKEKTGEDIRVDVLGVTQLEYTWSCEEKGLVEEERNYLTAWFVPAANLSRPIGPDGLAWTDSQHPYSRYKKAFKWGDLKGNITFKYDSTDVECKITSISVKTAMEVDYKRDDGGDYSNGRELKSRDYEITMTVRPTGSMLRTISNTHYSAYDGDITFNVKMQRGADTNDYIQWAFTKLRLLNIPQNIQVANFYEEIDIILHAAPGNDVTCTVKGYLSQQYYGVD